MARPKREEPRDEVAMTIRFPRDVRDELDAAAERDDRSINAYVVRAVKDKLEGDRDAAKPERKERR